MRAWIVFILEKKKMYFVCLKVRSKPLHVSSIYTHSHTHSFKRPFRIFEQEHSLSYRHFNKYMHGFHSPQYTGQNEKQPQQQSNGWWFGVFLFGERMNEDKQALLCLCHSWNSVMWTKWKTLAWPLFAVKIRIWMYVANSQASQMMGYTYYVP